MAISRFFLRKKKKKVETQTQKLKKFIGVEISAESAMVATGKVLIESMEIAKDKKDVDGLLAVADRWYNISRLILDYNATQDEQEEEKKLIGFTGGSSVANEANTRETDNEGESIP